MKDYQKPDIEIIKSLFSKAMMDGFSETGGENTGTGDDPVQPGDPSLSNHSSIWDEEDE